MVDGMVLDVKRWLPEHPGGDRIIPSQSVNVDATRHFELYHSSKESFCIFARVLRREIVAEDLGSIPPAENEPSDGAVDPRPPAARSSSSSGGVHARVQDRQQEGGCGFRSRAESKTWVCGRRRGET